MSQTRNPFLEKPSAHRAAGLAYNSRPHDVRNLRVSLKQWRIFHAVIDCGGFAEAAKHLHLSQSAISYTVAKLQEQLGVQLLRIEGRRAHLTSAGKTLLDRSRHVLKEAVELELFAKKVGQGCSSEVRLVVDHHFPTDLLMAAIHKFSQLVSGSWVRLSEAAMPRPEDALRDLSVDLVISGRVPLGFLGEPLIEVDYVAVAHPMHPLLHLGRDITAADLEHQVQVAIGHGNDMERSGSGDGRHMSRWQMSSVESVVEALCGGFGYAWLPRHRVQRWLDQELLAPLPLRENRACKANLYLIHGRHWPANPAASRLAELLRNLAAAGPDGDNAAETIEPGVSPKC